MKHWFINFLSQYSYRKRFMFWLFLFFFAVPFPTYWIIKTQHFFIQRADIQLHGTQLTRNWLSVLDAAFKYEVDWTSKVGGEGISDVDLRSVQRVGEEVLDVLRQQSAPSIKGETVLENSLFGRKTIVKNIHDDFVFLEQLMKKITQFEPDTDFDVRRENYRLYIDELVNKIHQLVYDYHIVLQNQELMHQLVSVTYFSLLQDQAAVVDLHSLLKEIFLLQIPSKELVSLAFSKLQNFKTHFEETQRKLSDYLVPENFSNKASLSNLIEDVANAYHLNIEFVEEVHKNLSNIESNREIRSLDVLTTKALTALGDWRNASLDLFEQKLKEERHLNLWTEIIFLFLILLIAIIFIFFIVFRVLTTHFTQTQVFIEGLLQGRYHTSLNMNPNEEIGQMVLALYKAGQSIERVVCQLQTLYRGLDESNKKIVVTADEQAAAVGKQSGSLERLENTTNQIASKSHDLADTMNNFMAISKQRLFKDVLWDRPTRVQRKVDLLTNASTNILETLSEVQEKVSSTNKLIDFMTKVSDQASLLSLNAGIEALSVPLHERSFRDIIEKIYRFSESSAASTQAIQKIVNEMNSSVSLGKETAESFLNEISMGANQLLSVSYQLKSMSSRDKEQTDKFQIVNEMIQDQTKVSEAIIASLNHLEGIVREDMLQVERLYTTIGKLGMAAQELREIVQTFLGDIDRGTK